MGGRDDLRNFGYALASPGFEDLLERSDRGPNFTYDSAQEMAEKLNSISKKFRAREKRNTIPGVPEMKDVRLAMNVATCDGLPCLVVVGKNDDELARLKAKLSVVVWDEEIAGQFICASTTDRSDLDNISGSKSSAGYLVVQPDAYGVKGKTVATIPEPRTADQLKTDLLAAASDYTRLSRTHGQHVRHGRQNGITWETVVEVPERDRRQR